MRSDQDHWSRNFKAAHFLEQSDAVHLRHVDIGDDNMRRKLANLLESFLAIRGQLDQILFPFESLADPEASGFLVIDNEDTGWNSSGKGLHDGLECYRF